MTTVDATCERCHIRRTYKPCAVGLILLTHGVQKIQFFCTSCRSYNEFIISPELAQELSDLDVLTTLVRTPAEVLEWPAAAVRPIAEWEVAVMERSDLEYLNVRFCLELDRA